MKSKYVQYVAALSTLALMFPLGAMARDKNEHSVDFSDATQVGSTQLMPGTYQVAWQGDGPNVQVNFEQNGKTVATVPGTLKEHDTAITQDQMLTDSTDSKTTQLKELDFGHQKEALIFDQSNGM